MFGRGGVVVEVYAPNYNFVRSVSAGSGNYGGSIYTASGASQPWAEAGYPGLAGDGGNGTVNGVGAGGAGGAAIVQVSGTLSWAGGTPAGFVYGAYPGRVD